MTETNLLKPYEFNKEFFEDIKGTDYNALKEDIKQNGIKVELHVTKSNTILCGHQRWEIAKDLGLEEVPTRIIDIDESDERKIKEYVIKDNLLRRHLSTEQKYILIATLSEVYETGRGENLKTSERDEKGHIISIPEHAKVAPTGDLLEPKDTLSSGEKRDTVLEKTAKEVGVSSKTILYFHSEPH